MLDCKKMFVAVAMMLTCNFGFSQQVTGVSYYMEYDDSTCLFDFHIIIENGWAQFAPYRTQFGSGMTVVVPSGSSFAVTDSYMPLKNNQGYTGTVPATWTVHSSAFDVNSLGIDYHTIRPNLNTSAQYNDLAQGDTIKLFSASVGNLISCGQGVRFYQNGVDPNNVNGGDWSNGFTIGGPVDDFQGIGGEVYSSGFDIGEPAVVNDGMVSIELNLPSSGCNPTYACQWSGPNGYTSDEPNVMISPASSVHYGTYHVTVTDEIGCSDERTVAVDEPTGPGVPDITNYDIRLNPTREHIAVHVDIEGDSDLDSELAIRYRVSGTTEYFDGAVTMRAHADQIINGSPLGQNFHAGSALHLMPNTSYDVEITLTDPDGGSATVVESVLTKSFSTSSGSGQIRYVTPGTSGGDGTAQNPFQGLQTAANNAMPGDIFMVADGTYDPFSLDTDGAAGMPIIFRSVNLHGAIIDGGGTTEGIVTIGNDTDSTAYTVIDGFIIQNGAYGIDAQNTQYLTVENNRIIDVDYGFINRREHGWERDQVLDNNELIGRTPWPQLNGEVPAEKGIDIRGNRNIISHNTVSRFGDGISTDGPASQVSYALDIHDNLIFQVVDDLIEVDGTISNTRVYSNKGYDGRMGVSLAPVYGGPAYVFRNEFYNIETSAFKLNNGTAGLVIVHNSVAKLDRGMTSSAGWQNTIFQNNTLVSSHYVYEEFGLVPGSTDDWNHNSYYSSRVGDVAEPWFKWDGVQYASLSALQTDALTDENSQPIDLSDFENIALPAEYGSPTDALMYDFSPSQGSDLIDGGVILTNINDNVHITGLPDVGALESGQTIPAYGHDFSAVCGRLDLQDRLWTGAVHGGWFHPDNWSPCGVPVRYTTVEIPAQRFVYPLLNQSTTVGDMYLLGNGKLDLLIPSQIKLTGE